MKSSEAGVLIDTLKGLLPAESGIRQGADLPISV
jgi:hypothetical protein